MRLFTLDEGGDPSAVLSLSLSLEISLAEIVEEIVSWLLTTSPFPAWKAPPISALFEEANYLVHSEAPRWIYEESPVLVHFGVAWED